MLNYQRVLPKASSHIITSWMHSPVLAQEPINEGWMIGWDEWLNQQCLSVTNSCWLVVYLLLWKIWKSVGMMKFPIYGEKKKHVPNQQPGWVISHQNDSELHGFLPLVIGKITMYLIIFRNHKFLGSRATLSCNLRLEPGLSKNSLPKNPMLYHHVFN